jgi:hypothetical protein
MMIQMMMIPGQVPWQVAINIIFIGWVRGEHFHDVCFLKLALSRFQVRLALTLFCKCLQKGGKKTFRIPVLPSLLAKTERENSVEVITNDTEADDRDAIRNRAMLRNLVTDSNPRFLRGFNADTGGDGSVGVEFYRCICVCTSGSLANAPRSSAVDFLSCLIAH